MKRSGHRNSRWLLVATLLALLLATAPVASANGRVTDGNVPFYARIEQGMATSGDDWAFVLFYRPPSCVPADFNLLVFFDDPRAFGCRPVTTGGFVVTHGNLPAIHSKLFGLGAVPMWFMTWGDLGGAMSDGVLTVPELEGLPSLTKGTASFYEETLHPIEFAKVSMYQLVARGSLEDGREFDVTATAQEKAGIARVRIVFH